MKFIMLLVATVSLILPWTIAAADNHVITETTRSYMGTTFPKRSTEVWFNEIATCVFGRRMTTIYRFDLAKVWTVERAGNRYFEEPLQSPESQTSTEDTLDLHSHGFDYQPQFEWLKDTAIVVDTAGGFQCRKITFRGDADYAEKILEIWVATIAPIPAELYHEKFMQYSLDNDWLTIYRTYPEMKKMFVVKSRSVLEPPIASMIVEVSVVSRVETATPPGKTYDLPEGCLRVNSIDELFQ
jgi:hypothetical protein